MERSSNPPGDTGPALSFRDMRMIYADGTEAIRSVSLDVKPGEFVTIVGPSGCGKSTLLKVASGLEQHSSGSISVDRDSVGYVFPARRPPSGHRELRATVLEVEPFRPVIPRAVRVAALDLEFAGVPIAAGTSVYHPTALPHYLDEIYAEPMRFKPERSLATGECPRAAHTTFGGGSHICLGQRLARVEEPLALAIATSQFILEPQQPVSLEARLTGVVSPVARTIPVRIRRR